MFSLLFLNSTLWSNLKAVNLKARQSALGKLISSSSSGNFFTDAPELNTSCQVSERWLSITWKAPPMTYDILTGYNAWHWNESSSKWRMLPLGSQITSLNLTNLGMFNK